MQLSNGEPSCSWLLLAVQWGAPYQRLMLAAQWGTQLQLAAASCPMGSPVPEAEDHSKGDAHQPFAEVAGRPLYDAADQGSHIRTVTVKNG